MIFIVENIFQIIWLSWFINIVSCAYEYVCSLWFILINIRIIGASGRPRVIVMVCKFQDVPVGDCGSLSVIDIYGEIKTTNAYLSDSLGFIVIDSDYVCYI